MGESASRLHIFPLFWEMMHVKDFWKGSKNVIWLKSLQKNVLKQNKATLKNIVRTEFQRKKRNDKPSSWVETCLLRFLASQNLQKRRAVLVSFRSKVQANQLYLQMAQPKVRCVTLQSQHSRNEQFSVSFRAPFRLWRKFLGTFSLETIFHFESFYVTYWGTPSGHGSTVNVSNACQSALHLLV